MPAASRRRPTASSGLFRARGGFSCAVQLQTGGAANDSFEAFGQMAASGAVATIIVGLVELAAFLHIRNCHKYVKRKIKRCE